MGSASAGVGSPSSRQRSMKCSCAAERSFSSEACHFAMNSLGVTVLRCREALCRSPTQLHRFGGSPPPEPRRIACDGFGAASGGQQAGRGRERSSRLGGNAPACRGDTSPVSKSEHVHAVTPRVAARDLTARTATRAPSGAIGLGRGVGRFRGRIIRGVRGASLNQRRQPGFHGHHIGP